MDQTKAVLLKTALENMISHLNVPVHLVASIEDEELKHLIGSLSADIVAKIDFEILPRLCADFPGLKDSG